MGGRNRRGGSMGSESEGAEDKKSKEETKAADAS